MSRAIARKQVVARASEVAPGTVKLVTVAGREIGIFNLAGEYLRARPTAVRMPAGRSAPARSSAWCSPTVRAAIGCAREQGVSALSLARLGVRHPHRPILVRPELPQGAAVCRHGRAGRDARQRALCGRDLSDRGRGRLSGDRALSGAGGTCRSEYGPATRSTIRMDGLSCRRARGVPVPRGNREKRAGHD